MKPKLRYPIALAALAAPSFGMQVQALVAHYPLDEASGAQALDATGNGCPGTYQAGTSQGLPGAHSATGFSVRFDPEHTGVVTIPGELTMAHLRNNVSLAAWIRPEGDGPTGVMRIFGNDNGGWSCARTTSGLRFSLRFIQDFVVDCEVPLHQWSHVAFTFNGQNDVAFYLNGALIGQGFGLFPAGVPNPDWRIGSLNSTTDFFEGRIDDVQLYKGVLTTADVAYLYGNPGSTIDPIVGIPYCFGNGLSTLCPCFNYDTGGDAGCANSTGQGARLASAGSASVAADDLSFSADQLPVQPTLLFVGNTASNLGMGLVFGDGLRCSGSGVRRLGVRMPSATGVATWGTGLRELGDWNAGDVRRFQAWYRDPVGTPCGTGFNLSHGVQISFLP